MDFFGRLLVSISTKNLHWCLCCVEEVHRQDEVEEEVNDGCWFVGIMHVTSFTKPTKKSRLFLGCRVGFLIKWSCMVIKFWSRGQRFGTSQVFVNINFYLVQWINAVVSYRTGLLLTIILSQYHHLTHGMIAELYKQSFQARMVARATHDLQLFEYSFWQYSL